MYLNFKNMTFEEKRGVERIRTAVGAFAEPSLATRPQRLIVCKSLQI